MSVPSIAICASIGAGTGRGTRPQKYLMTPTPPMMMPKEVIMLKTISRS